MWGCIITGRCFNPDNIQNPLCSYRMPDRGSRNEEGPFYGYVYFWEFLSLVRVAFMLQP